MSTLSALVVDDEPLARERMRRMLVELGVQVVGEAENAANALKLTEDIRPNVVFLDIEMPGLSGLHMAAAMQGLDHAPLLVFTTGHSEYALDAFDCGATDYLLKPTAPERLARSLQRVRERMADRLAREHDDHLTIKAGPEANLRSLPVRTNFAVQFIPLNDLISVVAHDKHTFARTSGGEFRTYYTLTQLESLLPSERFLRIHDSSLVNLDAVVELLFLGDHNYELRLTDQQRLRVGRTRYAELGRRLGLR